jgi:LDH2 family malate/lactate/ureidoglycolate dehydrogenase
MPSVDDGIRFPAPKLRTWTEQMFQKVGVIKEDAALLTDSLIEANLRGVDTHGITNALRMSSGCRWAWLIPRRSWCSGTIHPPP